MEIDPITYEISTDPIMIAEVRTALRKMKNGKAGGKDEIIAELLKADMHTTEKWLAKLFRIIREQEKVPKTWKQGLIVKILKKGDLTECGNWRGITLTYVPSKVFGRVLIDRIRDGVNSVDCGGMIETCRVIVWTVGGLIETCRVIVWTVGGPD